MTRTFTIGPRWTRIVDLAPHKRRIHLKRTAGDGRIVLFPMPRHKSPGAGSQWAGNSRGLPRGAVDAGVDVQLAAGRCLYAVVDRNWREGPPFRSIIAVDSELAAQQTMEMPT